MGRFCSTGIMVHPYFSRKGFYSPIIDEPPSAKLGISVVIPSFNEDDLEKSLLSLINCQTPSCCVEIIVVINYPENSSKDVTDNASHCIDQVKRLSAKFSKPNFRIFPIKAFDLPKKHAGVGLARKIGMDEAAWRLSSSNSAYKIIACFDADATCSSNYLVELENLWKSNPNTQACSIRYEHPVAGTDFDQKIYSGIAQYELHLRYYIQAGRFVGHPHSHHTVGSSMACSSDAYMRYGGMNKQKAGEDFYFLQKIIPHGKFCELNSCCVYPSPRPSYRVPFGTGRAMTKFIETSDNTFVTYNFDSWLTLKPFFEQSINLYGANPENVKEFFDSQHKCLQDFLGANEFVMSIEQVNANTSNSESFQKRFFQWFDAFMLLKYMNFANEKCFSRKPVTSESHKILPFKGIQAVNLSVIDLLEIYRELDYR